MKWKADVHNWITDENDKIIAAVNNKEDMPVIAAAPDMYDLLKELRGTVNLIAVEMIDNVLSKVDGKGSSK